MPSMSIPVAWFASYSPNIEDISCALKLMSILKSTAIFQGLFKRLSSSLRILPFKCLTSVTPARITDWNVRTCSLYRYMLLNCERKSRKT